MLRTSGMFISGETIGTANSMKAPATSRSPSVSGLGLTAETFDRLVSPVTMSTKVKVPSTFSSRSSDWVS